MTKGNAVYYLFLIQDACDTFLIHDDKSMMASRPQDKTWTVGKYRMTPIEEDAKSDICTGLYTQFRRFNILYPINIILNKKY